jgi:putative salt-induced outer membrane protein YdiY
MLCLLGLAWAQAALGDEIITTTGDRLTGTILEADGDSILLKTAYAGIIAIDRSQVRSLRRGAAVADLGAAGRSDAASAPAAGSSNARAQAVTTVCKTEPTTSPAGAPTSSQTAAAAEPARWSPFTPGSELGGRVNFALSHESGNTDKDEIDFDYQLEYCRGWHRFRSLGALEYDTDNNDKTTDKWSTFNQYSRVFPSRWYGAAWLTLEHDRFADLRLRTLGGPAVGYLLAESDAFNLAVEAGPALLQEDFYGHPDQDFAGAAWFLRYDQLVWEYRLQPYHRQFGYAALDGDDKYLWQSWTGLRVPLAGGFTGAVEFEYDYDSDPALAAETTDTTLRLKLGYQW